MVDKHFQTEEIQVTDVAVNASAQIFSNSDIDEVDSNSDYSNSFGSISDPPSLLDYQPDFNTPGFNSYCVDPVNKCLVEPFSVSLAMSHSHPFVY